MRRKFTESLDSDPTRAKYVLEKMQLLYGIERRIREEAMPPDQIVTIRQTDSIPILQDLKKWMLAELGHVLPKSPTGQAIAYNLQRWDKLSIYTTEARLQIDNNPVDVRFVYNGTMVNSMGNCRAA